MTIYATHLATGTDIKIDGPEFVIFGDESNISDADLLALANGETPEGYEVTPDVSGMTTTEVYRLIMGDAAADEYVAMPMNIATQVINGDHFSRELKDWAWMTLDAA